MKNFRRDLTRRVSLLVTQGKSDIGNLIQLNIYYKQISESEEKLVEFCPGHDIIKHDISKFKKRIFDWKIAEYGE